MLDLVSSLARLAGNARGTGGQQQQQPQSSSPSTFTNNDDGIRNRYVHPLHPLDVDEEYSRSSTLDKGAFGIANALLGHMTQAKKREGEGDALAEGGEWPWEEKKGGGGGGSEIMSENHDDYDDRDDDDEDDSGDGDCTFDGGGNGARGGGCV
jgi:hypothetical protein